MQHFKSINPYTDLELDKYPIMNESDAIDRVVENQKAYREFKSSTLQERQTLLAKVRDLLLENKKSLSSLMTAEMGKPQTQAAAEIEKCAKVCDYYIHCSGEELADRKVEVDEGEAFVRFEPVGGLLMIMPWNFPFWQVFRVAAPGVLLGNSLLLKHAPNVQGCSREIVNLFRNAGFGEHFFTDLPVEVPTIEKIINHPHVQGVTLTGSTKAGSSAASLAGKAIKKSVLELGGSNPFIVLDDADIDLAVQKALQGRMQNTGQSCIAAKRFIVTRKAVESFTEALAEKIKKLKVEDPTLQDAYIGPMARADLAGELFAQYKASVKKGAKAVVEPTCDKAHFKPGMLTGVKPGMPAFDEETFGPLAAVTTAENKREALELAAKSQFGLGASVFTQNPHDHLDAIGQLPDGAVFFNDFVKSDPKLPFGGTKLSGYGRELGPEGLVEFANIKTVRIN